MILSFSIIIFEPTVSSYLSTKIEGWRPISPTLKGIQTRLQAHYPQKPLTIFKYFVIDLSLMNLISFQERTVKAKGAHYNKLNTEKLKDYFFDDDFEKLQLLRQIPTIKLQSKLQTTPALFYPGSGADILFPLLYVERLFPQIKQINFIFNDVTDNLGLIKTILDDIGIGFTETENKIRFYWKYMLVQLEFLAGDVFTLTLPPFDIYFERAFRIMKDQDPLYESRIYAKLNAKGLIVSDSGFRQLPLQRIPVPTSLSSYDEMIIGMKSTE